MGLLAALPALAHSPIHIATTPAAAGGWLDRLNSWRANAGLPSLSENPTWSQGDYNHSLYMVKNDEVAHQEISSHPYYTVAGDTAARNSNIYVSSSTTTTDESAIDWWMQAPFHAMGMMDPRLTQTGFGSYREAKAGWDMGATLDVIRGNSFSGGQYPVYFPGNNLTEPLTTYGGYEFPDPLQACPGYGTPTGLPVFVQVGGNIATTAGPVHSFKGNGVALEHCIIDSNSPSVGSSLSYRGGVIVIPRQPLQWGVNYVVALTVNGAPYTWSFTVGPLSGGTWSASFDMSNVPTTWTQGVSQTFTVKVTNTGNVTWASSGYYEVDLDLHFATSSGGSANLGNWTYSQALALGADVAPGGSATVTFTLTAPPGSTVLEALMIKEHQFWFDKVTTSPQQWVAKPVTVTGQAAVWSASFDMSTVPTTWSGARQTFSVKVTNTGNVTWPSTGYNEVDLDMHFATSAGGSANIANWTYSQALALAADVAPGGSATVTFTLTAPAGSTVLEALMIKEHQFWFDAKTSSPQQWAPVTLVAGSQWSASFDMSKVPTTWTPGVTQTFPVNVTNIGNVTWPSTGYNEVDLDLHFATSPGGSANIASWTYSQALALGADVAPTGSANVTFTLTAPAGSTVLEALMIKEHQFWFDAKTSSPQQWAPVTVTMSQATYDISSAPTTWTAGQSKNFSVKITNTSTTTTWISTGYYAFELDFHFTPVIGGSAQQASWLTSKAYSLPNDVAPGASATFMVTVTAPSTKGSMFLEAEMIKEHAYWFRDVSSVAVTVS